MVDVTGSTAATVSNTAGAASQRRWGEDHRLRRCRRNDPLADDSVCIRRIGGAGSTITGEAFIGS
jgi:hypothetical protein